MIGERMYIYKDMSVYVNVMERTHGILGWPLWRIMVHVRACCSCKTALGVDSTVGPVEGGSRGLDMQKVDRDLSSRTVKKL